MKEKKNERRRGRGEGRGARNERGVPEERCGRGEGSVKNMYESEG